jgi:hypothetical protein
VNSIAKVEAQKVLMILGDGRKAENAAVALENTRIFDDSLHVNHMLLMQWPDTSTAVLIAKFAMAANGILDQMGSSLEGMCEAEIEHRFLQIVGLQQQPHIFQTKQLKQHIMDHIDAHNEAGDFQGVDHNWSYRHIIHGYTACKYPYVEGERVLTWVEVIQMIALSKWMLANKVAQVPSRL